MATAAITAEIKDITGVTTADVDFIVSGQKFAVGNVPKELLKWASSDTTTSDGGDTSPTTITLPTGSRVDNIISVRRNDFEAEEVSIKDRAFIANTSSLKLATSTFPKYYKASANKIIVKPDPTDSEVAIAEYIDFTKIDDNCDLRNVVINYACFKEFVKLMMVSARQGDFSADSATMGTEHWIRTEEDSEMLMARVQTIQAQLGERTHFGQMSQQHYNLALSEIKSYIENHPKTLDMAMAMKGKE